MKASGDGVSRFAVVVYKVLMEYGDMVSPQINDVF